MEKIMKWGKGDNRRKEKRIREKIGKREDRIRRRVEE